MADRAANTGRVIGAVDAVAVPHLEAMGTQDAFVLALIRAEGRDDDVPPRHDLPTLHRGSDRLLVSLLVPADHVGTADRDLRPVIGRNRLSTVQPHDAEPALSGLLHEMPVGRDPGGILLLRVHDEPTPRRLELPVRFASAPLQLLAASG